MSEIDNILVSYLMCIVNRANSFTFCQFKKGCVIYICVLVVLVKKNYNVLENKEMKTCVAHSQSSGL